MQFSKMLGGIVLLLILVCLSVSEISACQCRGDFPCTAYSKADQVFIGKLEKVEKLENSSQAAVSAYFTVERMFKGGTNKKIVISFETDCRDEPFRVGETYFVYDSNGITYNQCNRTATLSKSKQDLDYAKSISNEKPKYLIQGRLEGLSDEDVKSVRVTVEDGEKSHKVTLGKYGWYEFITGKQKTFKVKVLLPFLSNVYLNPFPTDQNSYSKGIKVSPTDDQTLIEYDSDFRPNQCEHKEIVIERTKPKAFLPSVKQ